MNGLLISSSRMRGILEGKIRMLVLPTDIPVESGKDYFLIDETSNISPATIYVFKAIGMSPQLFDSLSNLHGMGMSEWTSEFGKTEMVVGYAFKVRPLAVPCPMKVKLRGTNPAVEVESFGSENGSLECIQDPESYDPRKVDNKALADDWRIVLAWYSSYRQTGKFRYSRETIENLASLIFREIRKRGIQLNPDDYKQYAKELYDRIAKRAESGQLFEEYFSAEYAMVARGAEMIGQPKITIEDFLSKLDKPFLTQKPYAFIVGGLANHGFAEGDIDVLVRAKEPDLAFEFRVYRQLPREWWPRIHFLYDVDNTGPFTNYIPLYDKAFVLNDRRLEKMSSEDMAATEVSPMVTFPMLKAQAGYRKMETYNIDGLIETIDSIKDFYPAEVDQKYDGMRAQIHKKGNVVKIWSEDGGEVTSRFPSAISAMKKISGDVVLDSEIEGWTGKPGEGEHLGRSFVSGYAHSKSEPDDSRFHFFIHDILYTGGRAINLLPRKDRLEHLVRLAVDEPLHTIPFAAASNGEEIRKAVATFAAKKGSEGAMIKSMRSTYPLTGMTNLWVKFKNEVDLDAEVVGIHSVEGGSGYNYTCAIRTVGGKRVPVGVTYNTKIKIGKGDIIRVAFVNLNRYTDPKTKDVWYNWWAPRPIEAREDRSVPDNTDTADRIVNDTKGEIADKPLPSKYVGIFEALGADEFGAFEEYPSVPHSKFVLQAHIRGKNVHLDDRRQISNSFAVGMTHPLPYSLSKAPETFEEAKSLFNSEILPKIKKDLVDPNTKFLGIKKPLIPIEWLKVQGESTKGDVGATGNLPAFFIIVDEGEIEFLALKPYFHEYVYHGTKNILNGKYVDRLIENREEWKKVGEDTASWMWFATENLPYVLSNRAVEQRWIPPANHSALPSKSEEAVPMEYRYWKKQSESERLQIRDALVEQLKNRKIKVTDNFELGGISEDSSVKFKLFGQVWPRTKGGVRGGPVHERYVLMLKGPASAPIVMESEDNPITTETAAVVSVWPKSTWYTEGMVKENTPYLNPKNTPANMVIIDQGTAAIGDSNASFIQFKLKGKRVSAEYSAKKEPDQKIWTISSYTQPENKGVHVFWGFEGGFTFAPRGDSFSNEPGKVPPAIEFTGPLFRSGNFRGIEYPEDAIKNAKLEPWHVGHRLAYINQWHQDRDELARIGVLTDVWWDPNFIWVDESGSDRKGVQMCSGIITDPDAIKSVIDKKQFQLSSEVYWDADDITKRIKWMSVVGAAVLDMPRIELAQIAQYRGKGIAGSEWSDWTSLPKTTLKPLAS